MSRQLGVIIGKQGSGKSELVKRYIIPAICKNKPVVIVDSMNEYGNAVPFAKFLLESIAAGGVSGYNSVKVTSKKEAEALFKFIYVNKLEINLVVEEADKYCSPHSIDAGLSDLINYGRHHKTGLIFISRRAAKLHRDVTSQADYILSFAQHEKIDIKALSSLCDRAPVLQTLQKFHYIAIHNSQQFIKTDESVYMVNLKTGKPQKVK